MDKKAAKKYVLKIKKLPRSMAEISAAIPADEFGSARGEAIKRIGANFEMPGFRKGHVPESILVTKVGEATILEEMAEIAIAYAYGAIIREEKLDVLGRPDVRITKIAMGNPLEFTLTTAILPKITLPDYKKLAEKEARTTEEVIVSDDDVEKAVGEIQKMRANSERGSSDTSAPLPPLDDAYVKRLGDFADVADFKAKLHENMRREKERSAKDKKRMAIMDAILAKSTIDIPEIIVEQELARMREEFAHDLKRTGLATDAYYKAIQKTQEELEKDWGPTAEKRAKTQLVVSQIAQDEKVEPDAEQLRKEVAALRAHYPDATEERAEAYVRMLLTNEKVFQLLES